jgi:predicted methyltransferase
MRLFFLFLLLSLQHQQLCAQKKKHPDFCGVQYEKKDVMAEQLKEQFDFLNVQENDTIVDIGAASGWYEGAFSAISGLKNISFVLLDIDSNCLSNRKVNNMLAHYSALKGEAISNKFQVVNNTIDSLWLPQNTYKKMWLMNTIHEIPDKERMAKNILNALRPGGELVILELIPKKEGALHGGCNMPELTFAQLKTLFEGQGFVLENNIDTKPKKHVRLQLLRFRKPAA